MSEMARVSVVPFNGPLSQAFPSRSKLDVDAGSAAEQDALAQTLPQCSVPAQQMSFSMPGKDGADVATTRASGASGSSTATAAAASCPLGHAWAAWPNVIRNRTKNAIAVPNARRAYRAPGEQLGVLLASMGRSHITCKHTREICGRDFDANQPQRQQGGKYFASILRKRSSRMYAVKAIGGQEDAA